MARARKKVTKDNSNAEFFEALRLMEEERGIPQQFIAEKIADAIIVAARKDYGGSDIVSCVIDTENKIFDIIIDGIKIKPIITIAIEMLKKIFFLPTKSIGALPLTSKFELLFTFSTSV